MAKKVDKTQLVKDFYEGIHYAEIALRQKVNIGAVAYWVRKLGLKRSGQKGQNKEMFSAEEKRTLRAMMETHGGRRQLLYILKGK